MTFPLAQTVSTANVSSSDSDPSLAREDLFNLITLFNQLIASANLAQGVMVLGGDGRIPGTLLPATFSTATGNLTLAPAAGVVNVQRVLRLAQIFTADLGLVTGTTSPIAGDLCYLVDGDGGRPCIGAYDGINWRVLRFQTTVGDVRATLTAASTLTATADL